MKKFDLLEFEQRVKDTDLSYRQICNGSGVGKPWLKAVLSGRFVSPDPQRVAKILSYINRHEDAKL